MLTKQKQYITLSLLSSGSIALSYYIYSFFLTANIITLYWTLLVCLLSFLSTYKGNSKTEFTKEFAMRLTANIIISYIFIFISSLWPWAFQPALILFVIALYNLQDRLAKFNNYATYLIIYALFSHYLLQRFHLPATDMLKLATQGILTGSVSLLFLALILPFQGLPKITSSYSEYTLKRSLRIAAAFCILAIINNFIPLYKYMWAGIAIVVVMQGSLGLSIQKAGRRIIGTIFGVCLGIALIDLLPNSMIWHVACALGLLLVGGYFIASSYTGALTAYTGLLAMTFSLLHPRHIALHHYLFNRLLDTVVGIIIAVICEIIIFPRSFITQYRKQLGECYQYFEQQLMVLSNNALEKQIENDFSNDIQLLINLTEQVKFEPRIMLSKRKKIYQQITARVQLIEKLINKICLQQQNTELPAKEKDIEVWQMISKIFHYILILRSTEADNKTIQLEKIREILKESNYNSEKNKKDNIDKLTLQLQQSTQKLIASYTKLIIR